MKWTALLALGPQPQPGQPAPPFWVQLVPLGLLVVVFYFALIRPQQKKAKQQSDMLKTIKRGDKIIASSGIVGTVDDVKDESIFIRTAGTKLEITKGSVAQIVSRSGESSES
jgi:preprotein translocase subunit YajC